MDVARRAIEKGWTPSFTVEGERYDMILDDGSRLYRVQVKYADGKARQDGSVTVKLSSTGWDGHTKSKRISYTSEEVDAFLVYVPKTEDICWLGPELFANRASTTLRYEPPKNNQTKNILLVKDLKW